MFERFNNSSEWEDAYNLWINTFKSESTRRSYSSSIKYMLDDINKPPWEISRFDLNKWFSSMIERNLAPTTRACRIAAVSSFYSYAINDCTKMIEDKEVYLHQVNPAASKGLKVKVNPYNKSTYLTKEELRKFLGAIDKSTVKGARDFALFTTYIYTGRRNSEIRNLRFEDISYREGTYWYTWSGKGKTNVNAELPLPVVNAIDTYVKIRGLSKAGYIFTSIRSTKSPLSMRETSRCFKRYIAMAGLNPKNFHIHCLRHSAVMLRKEIGDDIIKISKFLNHSSLAITQIYLHNLEGQRDESWKKVQDLLGG